MQKYEYRLNDNDYVEYLEGIAAENHIVQFRSLLFTFGAVPIAGLALRMMGVRNLYVYAGILLLYLFWIPCSRKIIRKVVDFAARKKLEKMPARNYPVMRIKLDGKNISVTQKDEETVSVVVGYKVFGTMMILLMQNGNQVIVPSRIFNEKMKMTGLLRELQED